MTAISGDRRLSPGHSGADLKRVAAQITLSGAARVGRTGNQADADSCGYARARANRALVTECYPGLGPILRKSPSMNGSSVEDRAAWLNADHPFWD